jgi:hypothetical protein
MKFYHLKLLKKSQDFGLMFIELVDFSSLSLGKESLPLVREVPNIVRQRDIITL